MDSITETEQSSIVNEGGFLMEDNLIQIDDSEIPTSIRKRYIREMEFDCD